MTDDDISEAIDDLVDRWYNGHGNGRTLAEYIGMDDGEYATWVATGRIPEGYNLPGHPRDEQFVPKPPPAWLEPVCRAICVMLVSAFFLWVAYQIHAGGAN